MNTPARDADRSGEEDPARSFLDAYLTRIGLPGDHPAGLATVRAVHRAHTYALPFENIDPVRGVVPSLAPADLAAKMLDGARGGYCYEHNTLLATALTALGHAVTLLTARVAVGADDVLTRPRTHMALLVDVPGEALPHLADVGFGSAGALVEPVPLVSGAEFAAEGRRHRLTTVPHRGPSDLWMLQAYADGGWADQYAFTREPFEQPDIEVINWHIATNPRSPFSQRLFAHRALPGGGHLALAGGRSTETRPDGSTLVREVADAAELRRVLAEEYGIQAPDDLRLPR